MLNNYYEFTIGAHYAPAIINEDYSGLDDIEAITLDNFMDEYYRLQNATFDIPNAESEFSRCEISNLMADCITLKIHFTDVAESIF